VAHHEDERTTLDGVLEMLVENGLEGMADAMATMLNEAMKIERSAALRAEPGERCAERRGYANGFKPKRLSSRAGLLDLRIPQVRSLPGAEPVEFYPSSLERGIRSERALKLAIAEMYLKGVSTRKVVAITEQLCGLEVTSAQVSRATAELDEQLETWRNRALGETPYLILDARYEKVRHGGSVVDCAVLLAVGVRSDGKRSVLGVSVSLSEAEVHWRTFLEGLQSRGLFGVRCITSDDHKGIQAALSARFPGTPWQRCQFHLQQNAQAYVPRLEMRPVVARDIRSVFGAMDRREAEERLAQTIAKYRKTAPKLAAWMEQAIPQGLTVFDFPEGHRRRLRTTNVLERLHGEIKRRTAVATLFPNEESLLRLVTAMVAEISDEWEIGRIYLVMENE
jgi:transposase-like protein